MSLKKVLLVIAIALSFSGCLSSTDKDYEEYESQYESIKTKVDTSSKVSTTSVETNESYELITKEINKISSRQQFNYSSDKLPNSNVEMTFSKEEITIYLTENGFNWYNQYSVVVPPIGEWSINGTIYKGEIKDGIKGILLPLELFINNSNALEYVKIGSRKYTKTPQKVNTAPAASQTSNTGLKYNDNHQVVVERGDILFEIIEKYNKENDTNYDLTYVKKLNPSINKKGIVYVGQVIQF